jgi:hypothetical protein
MRLTEVFGVPARWVRRSTGSALWRTAWCVGGIGAALPVEAYVGPGAGITALGALAAVILGILVMIGGLLAWPLRTFLRRRKLRKLEGQAGEGEDQGG